jgi:RNA polymerase sigma-70 factor (ECF subfamily)
MLRCRLPPVELDDAEARLWARLLVGGDREPPRIRTFTGAGSLRAWLRRCAAREALGVLRHRRDPSDDCVADVPAPDGTPEDQMLQAEHAGTFRAAFFAALRSLDDRERAVLRLSVVESVPTPDIAERYGVHRVTVARWIGTARAKLARRTGRAFRDRFGPREPVAVDQLDITLSSIL